MYPNSSRYLWGWIWVKRVIISLFHSWRTVILRSRKKWTPNTKQQVQGETHLPTMFQMEQLHFKMPTILSMRHMVVFKIHEPISSLLSSIRGACRVHQDMPVIGSSSQVLHQWKWDSGLTSNTPIMRFAFSLPLYVVGTKFSIPFERKLHICWPFLLKYSSIYFI